MDDEGTAQRAIELRDELVALLQSLPTGTRIAWGTMSAEADGWIDGWCDIWAPDLARPLGLSWVWTVTVPPTGSDDEDDGPPWPFLIIVEPEATSPEGVAGWWAPTVSAAMQEWAVAHAGRPDLVFGFEAGLLSDVEVEILARADRFDPPLGEGADGLLHELAEEAGRVVSACGADLGPSWRLVSSDAVLSEDFDLDALCALDCPRCRDIGD